MAQKRRKEKRTPKTESLPRWSESFKRAILESALDCIITMDSAGVVREFNPAAERTFGLRREEALGKELAELIIPRRMREQHRRGLARYLETGEGSLLGQRIEIEALRGDGSEILVELAITPFRVDNAVFFNAYLRDITERRKTEDILRHHAELLDQTHDAIMVWDKQRGIQFWNRGAEEMYGWKAEETQGQSIHELLATEGLPSDLEAQLATGEWKGRLIHTTRNKRRLHVETRFTPFQQDGRSLVFEIARDMSERVWIEQRRAAQYAIASLLAGSESLGTVGPQIIRTVAASGNWVFGSIWLWREQDKVLHCKTCWHTGTAWLAQFEKITLNTSLPNMIGLPGRVFVSKEAAWIKDVTRDPNFPRRKAAIEAGLCGGFGFPLFAEGEMEGVLELFSPGPIETDPDLLKLAEALGSQIGLFIRRRKVEEELQRQKEAAEAANAAKDRFLAMLSHELRTPLTPVLIWAGSTVEQPGLSPELQEGLKMVCRNVELEARLIDDLLDLTRLSRGKLQLQRQTSDLHQIVRQSIEIISDNMREKHLNLVVTLEATSHQAQVDPSRLQQVFWNVLRNASKFTPENGTVSVRSHNPLANLVRIEISDSGVGIAPENLVKIFDAFEQGDSRREGLGLGLAISKAIIDMHHGRISAKSNGLGQGATFVIDLPVSDATSTVPL